MSYAGNDLGKERLAEWEIHYKQHPGFKYDGACLSELRGLRCKRQFDRFGNYEWRGNPKPCKLPYSDHTSLWKDRKTGELVYVTQPYGLTDKMREEMDAFCKEYGLRMKIDPSLG